MAAGVALAWCAACGGAASLSGNGGEPEVPKRKPDGVLLEPAPALPVAVDRAEARGVVALRPGLSLADIGAVVRQLMKAFEVESAEGVLALLTPDATALFSRGGPAEIAQELRRRFARLEYPKMRGLEVAHVERAEVREWGDLLASGVRARPANMEPGDALVRIPMTAPMSNGERLFDDVLVLLLRRGNGRVSIAGIGETGP